MATAAVERGMAFEERERLLEQFASLERFDALCTVEHVMAFRDCGRRSVYRDRRLMARRKRRGVRGIGFLPSDVRACSELRVSR